MKMFKLYLNNRIQDLILKPLKILLKKGKNNLNKDKLKKNQINTLIGVNTLIRRYLTQKTLKVLKVMMQF